MTVVDKQYGSVNNKLCHSLEYNTKLMEEILVLDAILQDASGSFEVFGEF